MQMLARPEFWPPGQEVGDMGIRPRISDFGFRAADFLFGIPDFIFGIADFGVQSLGLGVGASGGGSWMHVLQLHSGFQITLFAPASSTS